MDTRDTFVEPIDVQKQQEAAERAAAADPTERERIELDERSRKLDALSQVYRSASNVANAEMVLKQTKQRAIDLGWGGGDIDDAIDRGRASHRLAHPDS